MSVLRIFAIVLLLDALAFTVGYWVIGPVVSGRYWW